MGSFKLNKHLTHVGEEKENRETGIAVFFAFLIMAITAGIVCLILFVPYTPKSKVKSITAKLVLNAHSGLESNNDFVYSYADNYETYTVTISSSSDNVELGDYTSLNYIYHAYGSETNVVSISLTSTSLTATLSSIDIFVGENNPVEIEEENITLENSVATFSSSEDIYLHHFILHVTY